MMLILSPTRELAQQIAHEAELLCTYHKFQTVVLVGGTNMGPDIRALNGVVDILVATPGRMLAHLTETNGVIAKCSGVKVLILDEADRYLCYMYVLYTYLIYVYIYIYIYKYYI
jgi:superfamily II DNA/RNA helicase